MPFLIQEEKYTTWAHVVFCRCSDHQKSVARISPIMEKSRVGVKLVYTVPGIRYSSCIEVGIHGPDLRVDIDRNIHEMFSLSEEVIVNEITAEYSCGEVIIIIPAAIDEKRLKIPVKCLDKLD